MARRKEKHCLIPSGALELSEGFAPIWGGTFLGLQMAHQLDNMSWDFEVDMNKESLSVHEPVRSRAIFRRWLQHVGRELINRTFSEEVDPSKPSPPLSAFSSRAYGECFNSLYKGEAPPLFEFTRGTYFIGEELVTLSPDIPLPPSPGWNVRGFHVEGKKYLLPGFEFYFAFAFGPAFEKNSEWSLPLHGVLVQRGMDKEKREQARDKALEKREQELIAEGEIAKAEKDKPLKAHVKKARARIKKFKWMPLMHTLELGLQSALDDNIHDLVEDFAKPYEEQPPEAVVKVEQPEEVPRQEGQALYRAPLSQSMIRPDWRLLIPKGFEPLHTQGPVGSSRDFDLDTYLTKSIEPGTEIDAKPLFSEFLKHFVIAALKGYRHGILHPDPEDEPCIYYEKDAKGSCLDWLLKGVHSPFCKFTQGGFISGGLRCAIKGEELSTGPMWKARGVRLQAHGLCAYLGVASLALLVSGDRCRACLRAVLSFSSTPREKLQAGKGLCNEIFEALEKSFLERLPSLVEAFSKPDEEAREWLPNSEHLPPKAVEGEGSKEVAQVKDAPREKPEVEELPLNYFGFRDGSWWARYSGGKEHSLGKDRDGLRYIAILLKHPNKPIHTGQLRAQVKGEVAFDEARQVAKEAAGGTKTGTYYPDPKTFVNAKKAVGKAILNARRTAIAKRCLDLANHLHVSINSRRGLWTYATSFTGKEPIRWTVELPSKQ